jgi:hypothetical protein
MSEGQSLVVPEAAVSDSGFRRVGKANFDRVAEAAMLRDCPWVVAELAASLGVRVGGVVRVPAAFVGDVRVELGRRKVGVAEHLLDRA